MKELKNINISNLRLDAYRWFLGREPLITDGKNRAEMQTRLRWLSEGSLHYHLSKFKSGEPPCPMEVALYKKFVESDPPMLHRPLPERDQKE